MDSDSLFSLLVIIAMIVAGIFFSAAETAFSALNRIRIKNMVEEATNPKASKRASLVLRMHDDFDNLLSTLLILNNVVTLIAAAVATLLAVYLWGDIGATISTVVLTIVVIFFGDITPKSLAKESPEKVAMLCAPSLHLLTWVLSPVNYLFSRWKVMLSKVFNTNPDDSMTVEELYSYVEEAQSAEILNEEDRQLVDNAIEFKDLRATDILTPRIDLAAISEDATEDDFENKFLETEYSRLAVYSDTIDNIVGVIHMWDFFKYKLEKGTPKEESSIKNIFTEPTFVAPSAKLLDLFNLLQKQKSHFAIVTDEYGGTAGIVTMEDILEELVGDIWDESDEIIVEFSDLGNNRHKIICSAYVKDMFAYFGLTEDPGPESNTVSGWIMDILEKVPAEGDSFLFNNLTVTVHKTEHRRVLECIVTVQEKHLDIQEEEGD